MKKINLFQRVTAAVLILLLAVPFSTASLYGQETSAQTSTKTLFKTEELDQMLAPIALYPDALLAQVLAASTYPLEVVSAARLVKANPELKGQELLALAQDKDWDPSVKAMLGFPSVLEMMDEQLDWTTKLGDAFLAQQEEVMDSVQRLRNKAYAQGNLTTSKEQMITVQPQTRIIIIEPVSPQVVYVPVYDPLVIYGPWWHPAYPPYYYYPRRYTGRVFMLGFFTEIVWIGWEIWYWNWPSRYVYINVRYYNDFTRHCYRRPEYHRIYDYGGRDPIWQHDPQHRRNVEYRDISTSQRFSVPQRSAPLATSSIRDPKVSATDRIGTKPLTGSADNRLPVQPSNNQVIKKEDIKTTIADPRTGVGNRTDRKPTTYDLKTGADNRAGIMPSNDKVRVVETKQKQADIIAKRGEQKSIQPANSQIIKADAIRPTVVNSRTGAVNQADRKPSAPPNSKMDTEVLLQLKGEFGGVLQPGIRGLR